MNHSESAAIVAGLGLGTDPPPATPGAESLVSGLPRPMEGHNYLTFGVGVTTENNYFVLDGGPNQLTERKTSPGDEVLVELPNLLTCLPLLLIYSFKSKSAFSHITSLTNV